VDVSCTLLVDEVSVSKEHDTVTLAKLLSDLYLAVSMMSGVHVTCVWVI